MDAREVIRRCELVARQIKDQDTRTYVSFPTHDIYQMLRGWMESAGLSTHVDAVGNLRGIFGSGPRLMIGSHLDAGPFDGILGAMLAIALVERNPPCSVEVIASIAPFPGDPALVMDGPVLDPAVRGYFEFQLEQGPVLDSLGLPLGVVEAIAGVTRWDLTFRGKTQYAGATPMTARQDALACAAEWIGLVEHVARTTKGLLATVSRIEALPGAADIIPGVVHATLDVRHGLNEVRTRSCEILLNGAEEIASQRGVKVEGKPGLDRPSIALHFGIVQRAVESAKFPVHRMVSGAGHDTGFLARKVPVSMLFLRSSGGIGQDPGKSVLEDDVDAALQVGAHLLHAWMPE